MFKVKLRKYTMTIDGWTYESCRFIKAKNDLLMHLNVKLKKNKTQVIANAIKALAYIKDMYNGVPESEVQKPKGVDIKVWRRDPLSEPQVYYHVEIPMKDTGGSTHTVFFKVEARRIFHV